MPRRPSVRFLVAAIVPVCIAGAVAAAAHSDEGRTEAQKVRHEHYEELGDAFKAVRDNSRGDSPDWAALEKAANVVVEASIDQQRWFPQGSGLPEIWKKPEDFTAAQKVLTDRAPKLLAAVKAKDPAGLRAAFKELGGACKNCHDTFRAPEE